MKHDYIALFIFPFLMANTIALPVTTELGPNYLYNYGYLSTETGSDG